MHNKVQLIAYVDRFGKGDIRAFTSFFQEHLSHIFQGGVHLLPFYNSIHGQDAGYDPENHLEVDPTLGSWSDIEKLSSGTVIMADMIVNHMSAKSPQFNHVLENGRSSSYFDLFMTRDKVFDTSLNGVETIYRPRPTPPFTPLEAGGEIIDFWTTFTPSQIDIDVESSEGEAYLDQILSRFARHGVSQVRFDAIGYAIKRAGTSCFMIPETFHFIDKLSRRAQLHGIDVLVEIHSHFEQQISIGKQVDYVYDFALPPLILHTIFTGNVTALANWLQISPKNCVTVLDTHDGIGIIDAAGEGSKAGLLTSEEITELVEEIHVRSNGESRIASGEGGKNLDIYQINCSYYSALGSDDDLYILARAIQFFCPGVPQVYYGGFLALKNDMLLMQKTGVHRDINRPYIDFDQVRKEMGRTVVDRLINLIQYRNDEQAFNGVFSCQIEDDQTLNLRWSKDEHQAHLHIDAKNRRYQIKSGTVHEMSTLVL